MEPMKLRARDRMHVTSGWEVSRGAEVDVRPDTRVLGPWERDMKDSENSGDLLGWVSGWEGGEYGMRGKGKVTRCR